MELDLLDSASTSLVEQLLDPLLSAKKRLINGDLASDLTHEAYHDYYKSQWHLVAGNADGRYVALQEAASLNELVKDLINNPTKRREEILSGWKSRSTISTQARTTPSDEAWNNSVDLAARLLLMLKFGVVKHQKVPRHCLNWTSGSLQTFVRDHFDVNPVLHDDHIRLPKTFDAWAISAIAGIEIDFTDNLAAHLLLVKDDSKLLIFHHASFLECQADVDHPIYPNGLVDETLRTLALLFPQSEFNPTNNRYRNPDFQKGRHSLPFPLWRFNKHKQPNPKQKWLTTILLSRSSKTTHTHHTIDTRLARCGNLQAEDRQIERFYYWRDRLVILKQAYDDATPSTLRQWWCDRRNGVQWYTFWVAILVLVITTLASVIQCVEGALQVYKAYVP